MKIAITYPPLESEKGVPLLGQNRQFQWFNSPTYIYPMVPACAATLLKTKGYDVVWNDAIALEWSYKKYLDFIKNSNFDLLMIESKVPVINRHWKIIDELKEICPKTLIVVVGDHVTSYPEETLQNCRADFVLTGGNYDFLLANLCDVLCKSKEEFSIEDLEKGIYYRQGFFENYTTGEKDCDLENQQDNIANCNSEIDDVSEALCGVIENTGHFVLNQNLDDIPMIDRELTQWELYSEKNGNYRKLPGTYTYASRDCWYHKCSFCSWTRLYPEYRTQSPEKVLDEIGVLIEKYGVKEIMDDSGAFPVGSWLKTFCDGMISRGYNKKVTMDCNMRFCALSLNEYKLMKKAGFRFVLFGLESANQKTLDRINKGEKIENMVESCKLAKKAGLSPHVTLMFGYPWEDLSDVQNTVKLGRELLKKGYAHTLQSTIVIPYPGTPLYEECKKNDWLATESYEEFDMRRPIMKTPVGDEKLKEAVQDVYKVAFNLEFIFRRIIGIRSLDDVKFIVRAAKKVLGHLMDFGNAKK